MNMSVLPISFHDLFGIDHVSEISTSAKRRKQLSIKPTALHSGLLSFSDAVFRNVIAALHFAPFPTDLSSWRGLCVVRVIRRTAKREQNRWVEDNNRVQPRKHVAIDAGTCVFTSESALLPTLCMSFQVTVTWIEFWLNESSILNSTSHFPAFT